VRDKTLVYYNFYVVVSESCQLESKLASKELGKYCTHKINGAYDQIYYDFESSCH